MRLELDRLADGATQLAPTTRDPDAKLAALRKFLYSAGYWNGGRPFAYDHADPNGRHLPNALLHNYLSRRLGQCVSMPILFLILAERLGLNVALASAPEHLFIRYTGVNGRTINLETTSGGHPARDIWFRQNYAITDRAIQTGLYMRSLTKREAVAAMASPILTHMARSRRYDEVVCAGLVLLKHNNRDSFIMLSVGAAYRRMFEQFRTRFPEPHELSRADHDQFTRLMLGNARHFKMAEDLGWVQPR